MVALVLRDPHVYRRLASCKVIQEGVILLRPVFQNVAMPLRFIGDIISHHHIIRVVQNEAPLLAVANRIRRNDRSHGRIRHVEVDGLHRKKWRDRGVKEYELYYAKRRIICTENNLTTS